MRKRKYSLIVFICLCGISLLFAGNVGKISGKIVADMILVDVGIDNYFDDGDWGMDVLMVGSSLGIGAIAVIDENKLIRLANTDYHDFKLITEGPIRSIFELNFSGWDVNGRKLAAKETITITAGRDGFKNCVEIVGKERPQALVAGLSMLGIKGKPETVEFKNAHGISLAGNNEVDNEFLGVSILLAKNKKMHAKISPKTADVYDTESTDYQSTKYHSIITDSYYLSTPGSKAEFVMHTLWGARYQCIKTLEDYRMMLEEDALHYFTKLKLKVK